MENLSMKAFVGIFATAFLACTSNAWAIREQSAFLTLSTDTQVNSTTYQTILTRTITLNAAAAVVAVADGRYFPVDAPAGQVAVSIDGSIGSTSIAVTDWGSSSHPVQHSFNAVANASLAAGTHTIALVASSSASRPGRFKVGSGSGLAVF